MASSRKVKVVLLAAGKGERFSSRGYTTLKCNLPVKVPGHLLPLGLADANLDYFCQVVDPSAIIVVKSPDVILAGRGHSEIVVTETQRGAAASAYLASAHLNAEDSVLVMDTDNYLTDTKDLSSILSRIATSPFYSAAGYLYVNVPISDAEFWRQVEFPPKTLFESYSTPTGNEQVLEDGKVVACGKNIGGYFFSRWGDFQEAYCMGSFVQNKGEITMASIVERIIGHRFNLEVPYLNWKPCGTPLQYERNRGW